MTTPSAPRTPDAEAPTLEAPLPPRALYSLGWMEAINLVMAQPEVTELSYDDMMALIEKNAAEVFSDGGLVSSLPPDWTTCTLDGGVVYAFHVPCRRAFIVEQEHECGK